MTEADAVDDVIGKVRISDNAFARVRRDGPWVIVYVRDGGGGQTTLSLTPQQAFDMAELLRGSGITAAGVKR